MTEPVTHRSEIPPAAAPSTERVPSPPNQAPFFQSTISSLSDCTNSFSSFFSNLCETILSFFKTIGEKFSSFFISAKPEALPTIQVLNPLKINPEFLGIINLFIAQNTFASQERVQVIVVTKVEGKIIHLDAQFVTSSNKQEFIQRVQSNCEKAIRAENPHANSFIRVSLLNKVFNERERCDLYTHELTLHNESIITSHSPYVPHGTTNDIDLEVQLSLCANDVVPGINQNNYLYWDRYVELSSKH